MKAFKVLCAVLVCAVLMCPLFAGCGNADAEYVDGSFNYKISSSYSVYVEGSFEVDFYGGGEYFIEYNIELYYKQQLVATKSCINTKTLADSGTEKVSVYESVDKTWTVGGVHSTQDYATVIRNVKITKEKSYDTFKDYAIGLGVTAAALACGITAFFVVTKLREKKDK